MTIIATCRDGSALGGTRTPNLLIRSQMLYPLSYERRNPASVRHAGAGGLTVAGQAPREAQSHQKLQTGPSIRLPVMPPMSSRPVVA
jgi:hypothetical protein